MHTSKSEYREEICADLVFQKNMLERIADSFFIDFTFISSFPLFPVIMPIHQPSVSLGARWSWGRLSTSSHPALVIISHKHRLGCCWRRLWAFHIAIVSTGPWKGLRSRAWLSLGMPEENMNDSKVSSFDHHDFDCVYNYHNNYSFFILNTTSILPETVSFFIPSLS